MYPSKLDIKSTGIEELCIMQHDIFTMVYIYIYIQTYITNKQIPRDPVDFLYFITTIHLHYVCIYISVYIYISLRGGRSPKV